MLLNTLPTYEALSRHAANRIGSMIRLRPDAMICIASGHTPTGVFRCLVEDIQNKNLDVSRCTFISLDEWVGIPPNQEGSCRNMMDKDFFGPLKMDEHQIVFFNSMTSDPSKECERINQIVRQHGPLDVMLVGVGLNGHIAMNEPGSEPDLYAHVSDLSEETITVGQKYFSTTTLLSKGMTLGLRHFTEASLPILMANGKKKAAIIQQALTPPYRKELPASIVQKIPQAEVLLDEEAGSGLVNL